MGIVLIVIVASIAAAGVGAAPVSEAAAFYHQGRFDSTLARLEALRASDGMKRRDSLALFQYLGMASARLGREPEAEGHFAALLGLDSLFQFPRNEDPLVLSAFSRARAQRAAPPAAESPIAPPAPAAASKASPSPGPQGGAYGDERPLVVAGIALNGSDAAAGGAGPSGSDASVAGVRNAHARGAGHPPRIGLALGALPFGAGWLARGRPKHGLALGILQAGGLALSLYASNAQSAEGGDRFRIQNGNELNEVERWQWVQRVSLSTAAGAYIFSLIASAGD